MSDKINEFSQTCSVCVIANDETRGNDVLLSEMEIRFLDKKTFFFSLI